MGNIAAGSPGRLRRCRDQHSGHRFLTNNGGHWLLRLRRRRGVRGRGGSGGLGGSGP
jgi:hypothetical protein